MSDGFRLTVEFPSVAYREGPQQVLRLAKAIEDIGYDQLDMFDHVVMGFPTDTRAAPIYPPQMPIMEALMVLSFAAAATSKIGLGTEVLVLPQRQPVLVAKQVSTLDTLSGGRVRLGVGVGWQQSEYEALGERFDDRGRRMDEAIDLLRLCWGESHVSLHGEHYQVEAMAMEPKPPQGGKLPIWIGGGSKRALRRVAEYGDGWLGPAIPDATKAREAVESIHRAAEAEDRDPASIGLQQMLELPPRDKDSKAFYADLDRVARRAEDVHQAGFGWGAVNATAVFQAGARSIDGMIDALSAIHERIRSVTG